MKKILFLSIFSSTIFLVLQAREIKNKIKPAAELAINPQELKVRKNCCSSNPYTLTAWSQSLYQSFKNLTAGVGVSNCHAIVNFPTVSFTMPESCFSHQTTFASMVTYSNFYVPTISAFRVIWGATARSFFYYGACPPNPILFPHPGIIENHVFGAKLIKQSDYKDYAGSPKDYNAMASVPAIAPADIEQIISCYVEKKGGYISTSEAANYDDVLSSKGIVIKVKLKTGASI